MLVASMEWKRKPTQKLLSSCLTENWILPYFFTSIYFKNRLSITMVWSNHWCIRVFSFSARSWDMDMRSTFTGDWREETLKPGIVI